MCNINTLKTIYPPELYYARHLEGKLGKPNGNGWHVWDGLCPFHADRKPGTLFINMKSGSYKCFSCGAKGGDIINFHKQRFNLSTYETLKQLGGFDDE